MRAEVSAWKHVLSTAIPPLLLTAVVYTLQHTSPELVLHNAARIFARQEEAQCPIDLHAADACGLVYEICTDFDDGLIPYLRMYACSAGWTRPILLVAMIIWLPVLFGSMATAAAEYLAVHLQFIVSQVGISENLAGVTIFAFGNGCSDLFATLAAMGANSGSLAISELFGAAAFITTVVLGCITLVNPFVVDPTAFVSDVVWFMIAASLLVAFLADGQLVLGECFGILGLYFAFVLFAIFRLQDCKKPAHKPTLNSDGFSDVESDNNAADRENLLPTTEVLQGPALVHEPGSSFTGQLPANSELSDAEEATMVNTQELEDHDLPLSANSSQRDSEESALRLCAIADENTIWKNFPLVQSWHAQSVIERILTIFSMPLLIPIGLTTAPRSTGGRLAATVNLEADLAEHDNDTIRSTLLVRLKHWRLPSLRLLTSRWILCLQLILGPQLFSVVVVAQALDSTESFALILGSLLSLLASVLLIAYLFSTNSYSGSMTMKELTISVVAFSTSMIWIYLTATSAVTLLMTLAWLWDIPAALLGATIFAIGQSSNDLVANIAVARRGMPVLAASATFGGPMMNMFIGIGGGGLVQALKRGAHGTYRFKNAAGLFVSAANLLLGLGVTLGYAFWNSWKLDRKLGVILICIWFVFTSSNVILSMGI